MTADQFDSQILSTFNNKNSTLHALKAYLKYKQLYDSHFLQPENVKLVKVGEDGKLSRFDVAFFRLKVLLQELYDTHNESKKLKDSFLHAL
jgi:hypothetical protein